MLHGRKKTTALTALGLALGGGLISTATQTTAQADSTSVLTAQQSDRAQDAQAQQVAQGLIQQAERASAKAVAAHRHLARAQHRLAKLDRTISDPAMGQAMRAKVASVLVDNTQTRDQGLSVAGRLMGEQHHDQLARNLSAMDRMDAQDSADLPDYRAQLKEIASSQQDAGDHVDELTTLKDDLVTTQQVTQQKAANAQQVVDDLHAQQAERERKAEEARQAKAAEQAASSSSSSDSSSSSSSDSTAVSGSASSVVSYAMSKVGDSYVYGASGPSSFDCSGLTMRAWETAGVSLPHSSSAQMGSGQRVSESELQPGDLVFYYSPVSHVGIYIGGGRIVSAENPSSGIRVTSLHAMPYSGAVRPG